jgi:hopanoid biosynthesis associated protein HpnK
LEGKPIFNQKRQVGARALKHIIVTADDFGQDPEVNRAVIQAYREGILTCASLMVTGPCAWQAVSLAKKQPGLRVGLHLVLVDGTSVLPHKEIPRLVNHARRFASRPEATGLRYFPSREIRRQLAAECEAQIQAFLKTGLEPDHLNSHHHLHMHPVVAAIITELARKYRIPAIRLPFQPDGFLKIANIGMAALMLPWALLLRQRLRRCGVAHNRSLVGLYESGWMHEENWLRWIPRLKPGITEIFCHPGKPSGGAPCPSSCGRYAEFCALTSKKVIHKLTCERVVLTTYSDMRRPPCANF